MDPNTLTNTQINVAMVQDHPIEVSMMQTGASGTSGTSGMGISGTSGTSGLGSSGSSGTSGAGGASIDILQVQVFL